MPFSPNTYLTNPEQSNPSGVDPIGKNVLVRMDAFVSKFAGGKLQFLDEQVEEERNVGDILAKLELVGDNRSALYQIDQHAARRVAEMKT